MKFYSLEYDCNAPATQQINVPTNTDYKVGIKVVRNGEVQDIVPSSMTLDGLSADADKTNGYVTFTENVGDSPSFVQKTISVDTTDYTEISAFRSNTDRATKCEISADQIAPFASKTLYGVNVKMEYKPNVDADFEEIDYDEIRNNNPLVFYGPNGTVDWKYAWYGNCVFTDIGPANMRFMPFEGGYATYEWKDSIKLTGIDHVGMFWTARNRPKIFPKFKFNESVSNPLVIRITLVLGEIPFQATFKLNENVFKSQVGDYGKAMTKSVAIEGTNGNDQPFSFNAVTIE